MLIDYATLGLTEKCFRPEPGKMDVRGFKRGYFIADVLGYTVFVGVSALQ